MSGSLLLDGQPLSALRRALDQSGSDPVVQRLLPVWFAVPDGAEKDPCCDVSRPRRWWFEASDAVDGALISLFASDVGLALGGKCDALRDTAEGSLALVLLTHHLPRRLWRGNPRAAKGADQAKAVCLEAIRSGQDQALPPLERAVVYGPLLESADPVDVDRACALFERLGDPFWSRRAWSRNA